MIPLIDRLQIQGVRFEIDGNYLRFYAPKGVINEEIFRQIVERKQEIVKWFQCNKQTPLEQAMQIVWDYAVTSSFDPSIKPLFSNEDIQ